LLSSPASGRRGVESTASTIGLPDYNVVNSVWPVQRLGSSSVGKDDRGRIDLDTPSTAHNSYRLKRPTDKNIAHDSPPTIKLIHPAA
jgi:hypothetical protein